jgi:hypothetical protein
LWLDWRDVDHVRGHVNFPVDPREGRRTKNNEARGVPLHPRVRAVLANLKEEVFRRGQQAVSRQRDTALWHHTQLEGLLGSPRRGADPEFAGLLDLSDDV